MVEVHLNHSSTHGYQRILTLNFLFNNTQDVFVLVLSLMISLQGVHFQSKRILYTSMNELFRLSKYCTRGGGSENKSLEEHYFQISGGGGIEARSLRIFFTIFSKFFSCYQFNTSIENQLKNSNLVN